MYIKPSQLKVIYLLETPGGNDFKKGDFAIFECPLYPLRYIRYIIFTLYKQALS